MMNRFIFLQEWFKKRSSRDRLYLFLSGFVFFYLIYLIFILRPTSAEKNDLIEKITVLQAQKITIQQQMDKIDAIIKTPNFLHMLVEQKRLTLQLDNMQQQLESLKSDLFSPEEMPNLTKKILNQQRNNVILISLEELPVEPWPPQNSTDKTNLFSTVSSGYQHILQIEFQNDYFSTIDYLNRLEKISRHMYWDSMDYKVLQYPKANVVIKFHVLSLQKS